MEKQPTTSMWTKYGKYCILGFITSVFSAVGILAWYINYILTLANVPKPAQVISPIELAGVTATLGGLVLVGAFYKDKDVSATDQEREYTKDLKFIGKLTLFSSVGFIITYFLLEYVTLITSKTLNPAEWIAVVATDIIAILAGAALTGALGLLVTVIRFL